MKKCHNKFNIYFVFRKKITLNHLLINHNMSKCITKKKTDRNKIKN